MVFMVLYPAVAFVAMFVVLIIMIILKHGPRLCGLRHDISQERRGYAEAYDEEAAYDHKISVGG